MPSWTVKWNSWCSVPIIAATWPPPHASDRWSLSSQTGRWLLSRLAGQTEQSGQPKSERDASSCVGLGRAGGRAGRGSTFWAFLRSGEPSRPMEKVTGGGRPLALHILTTHEATSEESRPPESSTPYGT
jgi:hypothetical protein